MCSILKIKFCKNIKAKISIIKIAMLIFIRKLKISTVKRKNRGKTRLGRLIRGRFSNAREIKKIARKELIDMRVWKGILQQIARENRLKHEINFTRAIITIGTWVPRRIKEFFKRNALIKSRRFKVKKKNLIIIKNKRRQRSNLWSF